LLTRSLPPARAAADAAQLAPNLTPPPGNPRFPLFDALRAIAALSVFLGHTITGLYTFGQHPDLFLGAQQFAYEGVAIFFLISGFLLYRPFVVARRRGGHVAALSYFRRRILRIVPAYWLALSVFIAASLVSGITTNNWWIFYGFGQVYGPSTIGSGIGVAWTLCIEVTFYAVLPAYALLAARLVGQTVARELVLLTLLAAASLLFRAHYHAFADYWKISTLPGTFTWFALGMGLAIVSVETQRRPSGQARGLAGLVARWPTAWWVLAALLSALQYALIHSTQSVAVQVLSHALYGVIAFFILLPGVFAESARGLAPRFLRLPALAWIGLISYAFYLYHSIVIGQVEKVVHDAGISARYPVVLVAALLVTVAVSAVSYYMLERPIMRWGSARARR
jgi:peptidoglycan/LPS O-acetylase OafA/YrhL